LDSWTGGSPGGQIKTIAELPPPPNIGPPFAGGLDVSGGRASADGSVTPGRPPGRSEQSASGSSRNRAVAYLASCSTA
jgi:hypothetical protein